MKVVALGAAHVDLSILCLGTMYYGTRVKVRRAYELMDLYFERGGKFIDTANTYAWWVDGYFGGESEMVVGGWMKSRGVRNKVFISTKVGFDYGTTQKGLRKELIVSECEKSLRRLRVNEIDLYFAHLDDFTTPLEEALAGFDSLITSGKVRFIGASNIAVERLREAHAVSESLGFARYNCVQQKYSYLVPCVDADMNGQMFVDANLKEYCISTNTTILGYAPLIKGAYVRYDRPLREYYKTPENAKRLMLLKQVANEQNATLNQIVLAWMLQSTPQVLPVFSVSTREQMNENLNSLEITLSSEQLDILNNPLFLSE